MDSPVKSVCVFCGSSMGADAAYETAAVDLGRTLAEREIKLIYGGASVGLMGTVADAALAAGGEVIGVIPTSLAEKELSHTGLTELHEVDSMHDRKALMADLSDAFIALPGGIGTLEELFETWTWAQLGYHKKPCGVLNTGRYYDALLGFVDQMVDEGFLKDINRQMLVVAERPESLLAAFSAYDPPMVPKWIDKT
ncbi:TIGR00730 family Rossman fold protein [Coralliovum pocilloporae]|uniref:LOG family protein n=1 Tax=Coralliovum pocilloporae TaxID=3066369 RepID=UPI00330728E3